jgi:GMP synthase-like glutamine amidotransferase
VSKPGVILQHGPDGPPGLLEDFLAARGIPHRIHPVWEEPIGDLADAAFVVSLGSECSAGGTAPAWIPAEVEALRGAVAADVPVLGLCFGGQALALALGGGVHRTAVPEIGWVAVESDDPEIPPGPWAQYHYELLEVPPGAQELARSPGGPAAFRARIHLGVQFHPEVKGPQMDAWLDTDPNLPADFDRDAARRDTARYAPAAAEQAEQLFAGWFARLAR